MSWVISSPGLPTSPVISGALTVGGQILAADGTAALPGYGFAGQAGVGLFRLNTSHLGVGASSTHLASFDNSVGLKLGSPYALAWHSAASPTGGTDDLQLKRLGAGSLSIGGIGNGQTENHRQLAELTTIAAAAFTDTTIQIPAGCQVKGVSVRVTTVIPTAATFDVGIAGATTRYGTGIAVAATTTYHGMDDGVRFYGSAISVRITPDLTPAANTGRVRVTIHYETVTPPTS